MKTNELEIFNKRIEEFAWRALRSPSKANLISAEANNYVDNKIKEILDKKIDNASKVKLRYEHRQIFKKLINLDVISDYANSFLLKKLLFFFSLKTVETPYEVTKFSKLIKPGLSSHWESMFSKFTPSEETLKELKLEKINNLNEKRADLTTLNLNLEDFEKLLLELYKAKESSIYLKTILLMLSCGRRPAEIFGERTEFAEVDGKLKVKGLAKKRVSTDKDIVIIDTFLPASEITTIRQSLINKAPDFLYNSKHSNNLNKFFREHIAEVFGQKISRAYESRSLFALYSYEKFGRNEEKNYYISQVLGHEDSDLETAFAYNSFIIPKESKYNLEDFSIKEELKVSLNGKYVTREELESIKENPYANKIHKYVSKMLIDFSDEETVHFQQGLNSKIRESFKKDLGRNINPKSLQEALHSIFH